MLFHVFLKNGHEKSLTYLLLFFVFFIVRPQNDLVKAGNQVQFFTPEYRPKCDELDNVSFNYQF